MRRDTYKFLSGFVASLAYTHAAYAVAVSKGIINEPTFLGRKWGVGFMWTEAVIYSALGLGLAYRGWRRDALRHDLDVTGFKPAAPGAACRCGVPAEEPLTSR